jgi:transcription termination factor Rho
LLHFHLSDCWNRSRRCKRLAELGQDVFLLIDSLTRVARAFNKRIGNTGRTMSGGVDVKAMDIPKQRFASARAFEEGGSLTIVATALDAQQHEPGGGPGAVGEPVGKIYLERGVYPDDQ